MGVRVLVCGSREWDDAQAVSRFLASYGCHDTVIHGAARGADMLADKVARSRRCTVESYPADWEQHGKAAGPIRNQQMLDEGRPSLVIAFGQGKGTDDMVRRAVKAGLKVYRVYRVTACHSQQTEGDE